MVKILNQFKDDITKVLDKRLDKLERKFNDMLIWRALTLKAATRSEMEGEIIKLLLF